MKISAKQRIYGSGVSCDFHSIDMTRRPERYVPICPVNHTTKTPYIITITTPTVAMRIGPRFNVKCALLMLDGIYLKYVETVKYLGLVVNATKSFKCSMQHIRMRFYRVFNSLYA